MMVHPKASGLVGLGRQAQPALGRMLRSGFLVAALVCTMLCSIAVATVFAAYQGQDRRGAERTPVYIDERSKGVEVSKVAIARFAHSLDTLSVHSLQYAVVYLRPLDRSAAPPPGISRWPEEGEVFLSPALREAGESEGIESRYGTYVGEIDSVGLIHPDEKLAYVNPTKESVREEFFHDISGFGQEKPRLIGALLDRPSLSVPLGGFLALAGTATALLVVLSMRMGLDTRREHTAKLVMLGASKMGQVKWHAGKLLPPLGIAVVSVGLLLTLLFARGMRLPIVGLRVPAEDFHNAALYLVLAPFLSLALYALIWLTLSSSARASGSIIQREVHTEKYAWKKALICAVAAPLSVVVGFVGAGKESARLFIIFLVLALIMLATMKDLIGYLLVWSVRRIRIRSRRRNDAEALVSAAILESRSSTLTRMSAILTVTMLITSVTYTLMAIFAQTNSGSKILYEKYRSSVVGVEVSDRYDSVQVRNFISSVKKELDVDTFLFGQETDEKTGESTLKLAADNPQILSSFQKDDGREVLIDYLEDAGTLHGSELAENVLQVSFDDVLSEFGKKDSTDDSDEGRWAIVFVAHDFGGLNVPAVKKLSAASFAPLPSMESPEESWVTAESIALYRTQWVTLFSLAALLMVFLALGIGIADERSEGLNRLAGASQQAGRPIKTWKMSAIRVGLPLGIGFIVGLELSIVFGVTFMCLYGTETNFFTEFLPYILGAVLIFSGLMWLLTFQQFNNRMKACAHVD